jgi:hypothetical protein
LAQAEGAAASLPAPQPPALPAPPGGGEAGEVAAEVGAAFGRLVQSYRQQFGLSPEEARARAYQPLAGEVERVCHSPPRDVNWFDLEAVARQDHGRALQLWEEVKQAAREEVNSGHRAARALEGGTGRCWDRARFLAVRAQLTEAWRPRDAQEQHLVDQLAQWQTLLWEWQEALGRWAQLLNNGCEAALRSGTAWEAPRLSDAEALERALAKVERLHRLYLRTLQALQARRRLGSVIVHRAGQVCLAQQQVNVHG